MFNSTFSTTTKCAFPIFILNYFSFVFSAPSLMMKILPRSLLMCALAINCGKDVDSSWLKLLESPPLRTLNKNCTNIFLHSLKRIKIHHILICFCGKTGSIKASLKVHLLRAFRNVSKCHCRIFFIDCRKAFCRHFAVDL